MRRRKLFTVRRARADASFRNANTEKICDDAVHVLVMLSFDVRAAFAPDMPYIRIAFLTVKSPAHCRVALAASPG